MTAEAVFDRSVEPAWLDKALTLRIQDRTSARQRLDVWMRDQVESPAGRDKTMSILARAWIEPPPWAERMIEWAVARAPRQQGWSPLHIGALLATYPFFGSVCGVVGRELALHGDVRTAAVCQRMRQAWGDRGVIDVGARSSMRTLRAFGAIEGRKGGKGASQGARVSVPPDVSLWMAHALQLTRQADEIDLRDLGSAPELFMLDFSGQGRTYPRRSIHGGRRAARVPW